MVSVIIPTYNRVNTIVRSINSVLNQTYKDIEVIVVDDCSSDNTISVLEEIQVKDNRLKIVKHKCNEGACVARNTGIAHATGSYIAFHDSDDEWVHNKLEIQLKQLEINHADVCVSAVNRSDFQYGNGIYPVLKDGLISKQELHSRFMVCTPTVIGKKEVFELYKFDPEVKRMQDFDWAVRASESFVFCAVSAPLVNVYLQNDSITSYDYRKVLNNWHFFLKKYERTMEKDSYLYKFIYTELADTMTLLNQNSSDIYRKIYKRTKDNKSLVKYIMSVLHILKPYYLLKKSLAKKYDYEK